MDVSEKTELWKLFMQYDETVDYKSGAADSKQTEIRQKALSFCSEFLPGAWRKITIHENEFTMDKLSGGFTNMLFLCGLADTVPSVGSEPRKALVRIQSQTSTHLLVREAVVFSTLADHGYGPRLLGVFDGGRLEEYLPSRIVTAEELRSPGVIRRLSSLLCRIHSIRQPTPLQAYSIKQMNEWIDIYDKQSGGADFNLKRDAAVVPDDTYPSKVTVAQLREEVRQMEERFNATGSPLVFCHKDMVGPNVLWKDGFKIAEDGSVTKNGVPTAEDPLVLIDFEFGGYDYRGFELGSHVGEYGNDFGMGGPLNYSMDHTKSTPELRRLFCEGYVKEIYKSGKNLRDFGLSGDETKDIEKLYQEVLVFVEAGSMFWGLYNIMWTEESGMTGMHFLQHARDRLIMYFFNKSKREAGTA